MSKQIGNVAGIILDYIYVGHLNLSVWSLNMAFKIADNFYNVGMQ